MSRYWGGILTATGIVACPCHLPLTLPIILGLLGGTGLGAFIGANTGLVYGFLTGYFVVGIGVGLYLLNRKRRTAEGAVCEMPSEKLDQLSKLTKRQARTERRRARFDSN